MFHWIFYHESFTLWWFDKALTLSRLKIYEAFIFLWYLKKVFIFHKFSVEVPLWIPAPDSINFKLLLKIKHFEKLLCLTALMSSVAASLSYLYFGALSGFRSVSKFWGDPLSVELELLIHVSKGIETGELSLPCSPINVFLFLLIPKWNQIGRQSLKF